MNLQPIAAGAQLFDGFMSPTDSTRGRRSANRWSGA
jgi:hypothetical protein